MHYHRTILTAWISCSIALMGGTGGLFWAQSVGLGGESVFSWLILGVWFIGALWSWYALLCAWKASRSLRGSSARPGRLGGVHSHDAQRQKGLFGPLWTLFVTHPRACKDRVLDCVDECLGALSLGGMRYISGSLIFLGLVGTLYGLSDALRGLSVGINALAGDDMAQLKQQLQQPLEGMAAAFSASLLGVAGTLTMGFFVWQWKRARHALRLQAEHWATQAFGWRPEGETWLGTSVSEETVVTWLKGVETLATIYSHASIHHENLAKGTEIIGQRVDKLTELLRMHYQETKEWHQDQLIHRQILEHIQRQLQTLSREKTG